MDYYILDTRSMVGNCALWWRPNREGYTCQLHGCRMYQGELPAVKQ